MTGFGTPRDVKGKHLKRIWELEFPEEAADYQPPPVNAAPQQFQQQPFSPTQQQQPQQQQFQQRAGQPQVNFYNTVESHYKITQNRPNTEVGCLWVGGAPKRYPLHLIYTHYKIPLF